VKRIYWDAMLFIYWMESNPVFGAKVDVMFRASLARRDEIYTSIVTLGEVLVLPIRQQSTAMIQTAEAFFDSGAVKLLPVNRDAMRRFAEVRATTRIASTDALHLACAGAYGVDLFLTNDKALHKHQIPGIRRIAGIDAKII